MAAININFDKLALLLLAFLPFFLKAQDSNYVKKKVNATDLNAVLSYYTQTGDHSAVTGGTGTETLKVFSAKVNVDQSINEKNHYLLDLGMDVVTSASTDRIDFKMSSASRVDQHTSVGLGYSHNFDKGFALVAKVSGATESDYLSRGAEIYFSYEPVNMRSSYSLDVQAFFDDLRWGRLHPPIFSGPLKLVYPAELRDTNWFSIYNRNSYNFAFAYHYDLNPRMTIAFFPTYSYQEGLLSTPFHRVYFTDGDLRVENLPNNRNQYALGTRFNYFYANNTILRTFYQFYVDDFGVLSNTIDLETFIKVKPTLALGPHIRFYHQRGSNYFEPYRQHIPSEEFYTSDYDLSTFWSANVGLSFSFLQKQLGHLSKLHLGKLSLRYSYYYRSNGLKAHIITSYFDLSRKKEKTGS